MYQQLLKKFPKIGSTISIPVEKLKQEKFLDTDHKKKEIRAKVRDINIIKGTVRLDLENDAHLELSVEILKQDTKL